MAKFRLAANAEVDLLTQQELRSALADQAHEADERELARLRASKYMRLALVTGKAVAGVLTMGGDTGQQLVTPESGYVWSLRHLVIEGLATGTTPDIVNIIRNGRIIWQLNGNQFGQTWGIGEIEINAGETLTYQSVGSFASTGTITAHGAAWQTPAQLAGRFGGR